MTFDIISAARTNPGKVRSRNEDSMLDRAESGLWVVADGMGGYTRGDWASGQVVAALSTISRPNSAQNLLGEVRERIHCAHDEIRSTCTEDNRAGSTVVALLIFGEHFACLWAGDSRLYRLRAGGLQQLTQDHSVVQELVDAGLITPEAALHHPKGNIITRAIGIDELKLGVYTDCLAPGDVFLLCTDGLTKMVGDSDIAVCLTQSSPSVAAETLVQRALDAGGRDNVTVVVVHVRAHESDETVLIRMADGKK